MCPRSGFIVTRPSPPAGRGTQHGSSPLPQGVKTHYAFARVTMTRALISQGRISWDCAPRVCIALSKKNGGTAGCHSRPFRVEAIADESKLRGRSQQRKFFRQKYFAAWSQQKVVAADRSLGDLGHRVRPVRPQCVHAAARRRCLDYLDDPPLTLGHQSPRH